jgi:hypothetical protein
MTPSCLQHQPENPHEPQVSYRASCHGCLLIAETSCEQHNDFLTALWLCRLSRAYAEFFKAGQT